MSISAFPAGASEALAKLQSLAGCLADLDAASMPAEALGQYIRDLVQADAVLAAALAQMLAAYDAKDGHLADGQRSLGAWLVHMARVTRGQAAEFKAMRALPRDHGPLLAGLRTRAVTTSEALQLAKWTRQIPAEYRGQAEEILVAAARAGADLRALAQICAEIRSRTVPPDPDGRDPALDRALFLDTTLDGAGVIRGDLTPECAAMVQAVLDALSAPDRGRGPADPAAALPRRARRGDEAPPGLRPAAAAGRAAGQSPGPHDLRRPVRPGRGLQAAGGVDRRSTGPGGPASGPPRRSAPGTAGPVWRATRPAGWRATRSSSRWSPATWTWARWSS